MPKFRRRRRSGEGRIGDELRTHIAQRADHIAAEGVPRGEALRRAHEEFGAIEAYEAECRREHRLGAATRALNGLSGDIVHGWRRLRATPLFTIFAVVSLAAGVGVTTAMYSVVESVFWRPSGIPDGARVAFVTGANSQYGPSSPWRSLMSRAEFQQLAESQTSFTSIAATSYFFQAVQTDDASVTVQGEGVTGAYFHTVGVPAALGRTLDANDEATRSAVAVVSHAFWKRQLGGDAAAVGRVVRIGGRPFEIVGVAAPDFEGTILQIPRLTEIWMPLSSTTLFVHMGSASPQAGADPRVLSVIGRLADARDAGRASAEMASISKHFDDTAPISRRTGEAEPMRVVRSWRVTTVDAAYARAADFGSFGTILLLLVAMVLIVACTNLANLTLARGAARQHEQSVRRALGASRWRLVREHAVESGIVAALGGLGAFAVTRLILTGLPEIPIAQGFALPIDASLSPTAIAASAAAVLLSLTVFGIGPALQLTRGSVRADLAHGVGGVGPAPTPSSRRSIRWQVAIAATFFIIATASMKAVIVEMRHDPGIDLDRIAVGHISFYLQRWDEARARRAIDAVLEQGRRQPQLETIAVSSGMPFGTTMTPYFSLARPGEAFKGRGDAGAVTLAASPEIFRALGIDLLHGRTFDQRDTAASQPVVVMGARAALDVFGTTNVVGRDVQLSRRRMIVPGTSGPKPELASIIGVVSDADTTHLMTRSGGIIYRPLAQQYEPMLTVVGRAKGSPRAAVDAIRAAVRAADPELSVDRAGTGFMMLAGFYLAVRVMAVMAGGLGLLALLLSMAGLHGVLAQMVAMRAREVGLRIALGAERRAITRMVLGDGFRPIIQGLTFGLLLGVLGRFVLRATTAPDLSVFDPVGLVIIPIPVLLAGWLACYVPARRAAQVDPNVALKAL